MTLALLTDPQLLPSVGSPALWGGFLVFVVAMLALDLGVFHRKTHAVGFKEAAVWSCVWVALALCFNAFVAWRFGSERGLEFLTGYLIEKSLSIDNIFVFVVIFAALGIPALYQHRVLFWGILSALVLRAGMIFAGTALLARFHWLIYVFGAFLVLTGIKLFVQRGKEAHPEEGWSLRLARRLIPSSTRLDGDRFFTRENGKRLATPLFLALVLVEITDVIFAVDSIPAIFAITTDPFLVFTSNIFAILGLRSLFFLLGGLVEKFRYLKVGLSGVLVFVGAKMTLIDVYKVPPALSLVVVLAILGASVAASLLVAPRPAPKASHPV
ncbi:MAG: TerC family protein [Planctomycetes bacterium]|nr:TerC family protein [Planctomycetota bacterium]